MRDCDDRGDHVSNSHALARSTNSRTAAATMYCQGNEIPLNNALDRTARESKGMTALCFNPRHGIRVTRAGVTTDFVICLECLQVQVWQGDKRIADFSTNSSAEPSFDRVLLQAGVKLAPKHDWRRSSGCGHTVRSGPSDMIRFCIFTQAWRIEVLSPQGPRFVLLRGPDDIET